MTMNREFAKFLGWAYCSSVDNYSKEPLEEFVSKGDNADWELCPDFAGKDFHLLHTDDIIFADDLDTEPDTIDSLRQEIARLTADRDDWRNICSEQTLRAEQAEQKVAIAEKGLKEIISNDSRSHFNRVDAMTLTLWARETLNKLKAVK